MIKRDNVRVCVPRYMQIGKGSLSQLPEILNIIGSVKSPLIVTDKQMVKFGYVKKLQEILLKAGLKSSVFDDTIPDPTDTVVLNGIDILKKNKNDAVIGFGGGSPIDTAKAIAVLSQYSKNIQDYKPPSTFDKKGLPIIAIPTTAGTGSEVTHHSVIIDTKSNNFEKISCRGEGFVPIVSIVDYELTLSKPRRLTIDSAIDTLTHGIEAYVSKKATMFSDRMALDTIRLVQENIYAVDKDPKDLKAREGLMLAACEKLIKGLYKLNNDFDVPSMRTFGIDEKNFEGELENMATDAEVSGAPNLNPRVPTVNEMVDLYGKAWRAF